VQGDQVVISAADGAAALSPVAIALDGAGVRVRSLSLRTPTLDDVFLELTGSRLRVEGSDHDETKKAAA
jgi:ABC-2 type transport system ATP-binding protein